jgi:DNA-binding MarR family transcriptional regulator
MTSEKEPAAVHRHTGHSHSGERQWYILSSHGVVLLYISLNPDCTIRDIAEALFLTHRTIWGIIGELRKGGMIHVRKDGRRHHYTLNFEGRLRHPIFQGYAVSDVLRLLVERIPSYMASGRP